MAETKEGTQKKAVLVYNHNAFDPSDRRTYNIDPGTPLIEWLLQYYPNGLPYSAQITVNNIVLQVKHYDYVVQENDVINIFTMVKGGIGETALNVVTTINPLVKLIVKAVDFLAGIEIPDIPTSFTSDINSSKSYNSRAQSNIARKNEPIPVQYGRFRQFPDLAASPWVEYIDDEQFLHQLFCLGQGEFDIEDINLGDIPAEEISDLEFELTGPRDPVTLFETNVFTNPFLTNSELFQTGQFSRTSTTIKFSQTNDRIDGPSSLNFNEYLKAGDFILIQCATSGFEGVFEIDTVNDTEIFVVDSSSWPGNDNNPGLTTIFNNQFIKRVLPGQSINQADPFGGFNFSFMITTGYVSAPLTVTTDEFFIDITYPDGLFEMPDGTILEQTASYNVHFRELDANGDFVFTAFTIPFTPPPFFWDGTMVLNLNSTVRYGPTDTTVAWEDDGSAEFFDNGVPIPGGDIVTIVFGDDIGGAFVEFTAAKVGPITFEGNARDYGSHTQAVGFSNTSAATTPKRFTVPVTTSLSGRFLVYIRRTNGYLFSDNKESNAVITGLKAQLENVINFGPFTFLATTLKATSEITASNSRRFNIISTRKVSAFNGTSFDDPAATQSIAWAIADVWLATYGGSRPLDTIDLDGLLVLDGIWAARGDRFDGVFDQRLTVWEAVTKIARAGRAKPFFDGEKLIIVRDEIQTIRTALFNQNNIIKGSLAIQYQFDSQQDPDGIRIKYMDEDANYQEAEVLSNVNSTRPKEIQLFGVTNYNQAFKESQYMDAQQALQKQVITFDTELEGHIPLVQDLITVSHDVPDWAQGGKITDKTGLVVTTTEPLDFSGTAPFNMVLRREDGTVSGPWEVTQGVLDNQAIFVIDPDDITFLTELSSTEQTYYNFYGTNNLTKDVVVTEIVPKSVTTVTISAIPFILAVHTADTVTIPPKPTVNPSATTIPPKVGGLTLTNVPGSGDITAVWNPLFDIDNYVVERSTDFVTWTPVGSPVINTITFAFTGFTYVRVASEIGPLTGEFDSSSIIAT